jgi:hypothetical protein
MFKLVKEPTAWIDIEWDMLDEDGYETQQSLRMKVALVEADEAQKLLSFTLGQASEGDFDNKAFIRAVAREWDEIVDEHGKPYPFSAANLDVVMQAPGFLLGWNLSYIKAWNGRGKVREKNLPGSPGDGRASEEAGKK